MSFDWLRAEVSEEFARFSPRLEWWQRDTSWTRGELEWVLKEPAPFAFTPEGFELEARRLRAEADERDAQWLAQLELRRESLKSRASRREWQRRWYASLGVEERQRLLAKRRQRYLAADKALLRQQARARYAAADEAAVEARRQALRDYKAAHREYFAAKQREYSARNRERLAAEQRQRYEAKRAAIVGAIRQKSGVVPVAQCAVCGRDFATKEWLTRHAKAKHGQPAQPEASL